jgi:uncharacterized repeat protein (TIGR01451 family)
MIIPIKFWLGIALMALSLAVKAQVCAAPGLDGPVTVAGVVNTYHAGAGTAAAGGNVVTVASVAGQRSNSRSLVPDDLVLIMQMQDSAVPANAGLYEYAQIRSIAGNVITLNRNLTNSYVQSVTAAANVTTAWRTFQVVRIPQYASATISTGNTVNADRWTVNNANGQGTGGIVAMDVAGSMVLNGTINVDGAGFRGGAATNGAANRAGGVFNDLNYAFDAASVNGAVKGEGTVGTPYRIFSGVAAPLVYPLATFGQGYAAGAAGQSAQGNAAGGGNDGLPATGGNQYNSGGGGGGNTGAGGRGGNSWTQNNAAGGLGGGAVTNSIARLVLGGGGGSGSTNNNAAANAIANWPPTVNGTTRPLPPTTGTTNGATGPISVSGASGGGVVLLRVGTLTASAGAITAKGYTAYNTSGGSEGAGGGGAGGSVSVLANTGNGAGLTIDASGGGGGYSNYYDHGPGGGGGGGFVLVSTNLTSVSNLFAGGDGGYDGCCGGGAGNGSPKPYSAAGGTGGTASALGGTPIGVAAGASCLPVLTVAKSTTTPVVVLPGGTTAQYVINVSNAATSGVAYGVSIRDILPVPFGLQTLAATATTAFSGAGTTGPSPTASNSSGSTSTVAFGVAGSANSPTTTSFTIFPGGSVTVSFVVNVNTTTLATYQNNASVTFSDPTRTTGGPAIGSATINPAVSPGGTYANGAVVGGTNYLSGSSTVEDVKLMATTVLSVTKTNAVTTLAAGSTTAYTVTFSNTGAFPANNATIKDSPSAGLSCTTVTCVSTTGGASCPVGLTLGVATAVGAVPNLFNGTGIAIATFPGPSTVNLRVDCGVTATGQ